MQAVSDELAHAESSAQALAQGSDADEHAPLWRQWNETRDASVRQQLISTYLPHARMLAAKTYATRTRDDVPFADYYQLACLGLIEAVDRYDPQRGVRFRSYAAKRVVGAILNGLENQTEKTSQVSEQRRLRRERMSSIKDAARAHVFRALQESGTECEAGHEAETDSAVEQMSLDDPFSSPQAGPLAAHKPEALFLYLAEVSMGVALGILLEDTAMIDHEAFGIQGWAAGPEVSYFRNDTLRQLQADCRQAIDQLAPAQQLVVQMHYLQSMAFTDIAQRLALSRGRVSQLHRQALEHLRHLIRPPPDFDMTA
jgi:RNA polymerase sigma factor FliA